jgi:hypothetical protein
VIFDLVDWAIPHINKAIEEGIVLFDFVEENMFLEKTGTDKGKNRPAKSSHFSFGF